MTAPGVPAAFKVEILPNPAIPVPSEEIWRSALAMMYAVTDKPLMQPWFNEIWGTKLGPATIWIEPNAFGKDPSHLYTKYIIWATNQLLLSMQLFSRWYDTSAVLSWEGSRVGTIHVSKNPPARLSGTRIQDDHALQQLDSGLPGSLSFDRFTLRIAYGSKTVPKPLLYLVCIKVMGEAAEKGLKTAVPGTSTTGLQQTTFKLLPREDRRTIEAGWSREAATRALGRMILDNEFVETYIWLKVDGVEAAMGGYTQGLEAEF
ncbi:MAG: hypothetical protein Q9218_004095 [Villophora microphyllina]